jgi:hypothetical protein
MEAKGRLNRRSVEVTKAKEMSWLWAWAQLKSYNKLKQERSKKNLTPKGPKSMGGQLEIWVSSYDINFHCDFLKHFWQTIMA